MAKKAAPQQPLKKTAPAKKASPPKKVAVKQKGKTVVPAKPARAGVLKAEPLTHRLDALLHTMRTISQREDELCTLLHDARRTGRVNTALLRELKAVLAALPAEEYTDDLHAVLEIADAA